MACSAAWRSRLARTMPLPNHFFRCGNEMVPAMLPDSVVDGISELTQRSSATM